MPVLTLDDAEIHYEEYGTGFPLLLFAPGGMRSEASMWHSPPGGPPKSWNDWTQGLADDYRVIAMDQRNAGQSRGNIEADHGWHTYASDHLALMDHLGFDRFHVLGGCIGSSFCLTLCEMVPDRIGAAVLQNPIGLNPDAPTYFPDGFAKWTEEKIEVRPELDPAAVASFGRNMWGGDFVFCVSRDFVRNCRTPCLVLPGNDIPHPRSVGLEVAELLPDAEMLVDWKGPEHIDAQRERVVGFLKRHTP
ncbi:MAG: alpha/beta hydrolase [Proteobacteria bacterium]|nr:alpha/beta hydrolase [Pseudomonadota bacterium]